MATKMIQVDDYDGKTEGATPRFFSLDDRFYRLDLAGSNYDRLRAALQPFIDKAQPTDAPKGGRRTPAADANGHSEPDPADVRAWAKREGIEVNDKGRVPEEVTNRYKLAMADAAKAGQAAQ